MSFSHNYTHCVVVEMMGNFSTICGKGSSGPQYVVVAKCLFRTY